MRKLLFALVALYSVGCVGGDWDMGEALIPTTKIYLKGQNCNWSPSFMNLHQNTHVILEIESLDFPYSFDLKDFNLNFKIPAGTKRVAEFYAPQRSKYIFDCYIEQDSREAERSLVGKLSVG